MNQTETAPLLSRLREEIAKVRALPAGKRWEYIWEYYRLAFFGVLFALFFVWMIGTFLFNSIRNTFFPKESFSIAFAAADFSNNEAWMQQCLDALEYDEKQEELRILTSAPISDTADDFRISASVWLVNGQPDIFITDEATVRYLLELEALAELPEVWPEELLQLAGDRLTGPWWVDISGTAFAEAYGLTGQPVCLCMYAHGSGFARALDMVEYILRQA